MKYDCSWKKSGKNFCIYHLNNESVMVKDSDFHTAMEKMYDLLFDLYEDGEAFLCIDKKLPRNLIPSKYTELNYFSVNESAWTSLEKDSLWDYLESDATKLKIEKWKEHVDGGQQYFTDGLCPECKSLRGPRSDKEIRISENLDTLNGAFLRELPIALYSKDFINLLPNSVYENIKVRPIIHTGKREFYELLEVNPSFTSKAINDPKTSWNCISSNCQTCGYTHTAYLTANGILQFFHLDDFKHKQPDIFSVKEGSLPATSLILSSKVWNSIKDNRIVKTFEHERVYFA